MSRDDEEIIESQKTTKEKVHVLIDILMKKVPQGFDEIVKSLIQERTQVHVAEMLNKEFENKRRHCYCKSFAGCIAHFTMKVRLFSQTCHRVKDWNFTGHILLPVFSMG